MSSSNVKAAIVSCGTAITHAYSPYIVPVKPGGILTPNNTGKLSAFIYLFVFIYHKDHYHHNYHNAYQYAQSHCPQIFIHLEICVDISGELSLHFCGIKQKTFNWKQRRKCYQHDISQRRNQFVLNFRASSNILHKVLHFFIYQGPNPVHLYSSTTETRLCLWAAGES